METTKMKDFIAFNMNRLNFISRLRPKNVEVHLKLFTDEEVNSLSLQTWEEVRNLRRLSEKSTTEENASCVINPLEKRTARVGSSTGNRNPSQVNILEKNTTSSSEKYDQPNTLLHSTGFSQSSNENNSNSYTSHKDSSGRETGKFFFISDFTTQSATGSTSNTGTTNPTTSIGLELSENKLNTRPLQNCTTQPYRVENFTKDLEVKTSNNGQTCPRCHLNTNLLLQTDIVEVEQHEMGNKVDISIPSQPWQQTSTQLKNTVGEKTKNGVSTPKLETEKENHQQMSKMTYSDNISCTAMGQKNEISVSTPEPKVTTNVTHEQRKDCSPDDTSSIVPKEARQDDIICIPAEHILQPTSAHSKDKNTSSPVVSQKDPNVSINESDLSLESSNDIRELNTNEGSTSISVQKTVEGSDGSLNDNKELKSNTLCGKENTTRLRNSKTMEKLNNETEHLLTEDQSDQSLQDIVKIKDSQNDFRTLDTKEIAIEEKKMEIEDNIPSPSESCQQTSTQFKNTVDKKTKNDVLTPNLEKPVKKNHEQKSKTINLDAMGQKNEISIPSSEPEEVVIGIQEERNDSSLDDTSSIALKETRQSDITCAGTQAELTPAELTPAELIPTLTDSETINALTPVVSQKDQKLSINESDLTLESSTDIRNLISNKDDTSISVMNTMEEVHAASNDSKDLKSSTCEKEKTTPLRNINTMEETDRETDNLLTVDQCHQILQDESKNKDLKETSVSSCIEEKMETDDIPRPSPSWQQTPTQPENTMSKKTENSALTPKLENLAKENHVQKSKTTYKDNRACIAMDQKNRTSVSTPQHKEVAVGIQKQRNDCSTDSTSSVTPKETKQDYIIGESIQAEYVLKPTSANSEIINTLTTIVSQEDQKLPINESGLSLESSNDKRNLVSNKDDISTSVLNAVEGVDAASNDNKELKSSTCGKEKATPLRNTNTIKDVDRETDNLLTVDQCDQILKHHLKIKDTQQASVRSYIDEKTERPSQSLQKTSTQPENTISENTENSVLPQKLKKLEKENHEQMSKTTYSDNIPYVTRGQKNEISVSTSEPKVAANVIQEQKNDCSLDVISSIAPKEIRQDDIVGESTQAETILIPTSADSETINTLAAAVSQKDQKLPIKGSGLSLETSNDIKDLLKNKDDMSMSVMNTMEEVDAASNESRELKSNTCGKEKITPLININTVEEMDKKTDNLVTTDQYDKILQDDSKNKDLQQDSMGSCIEKKMETDDVLRPSPSRQKTSTQPENTMCQKTEINVLTPKLKKLTKKNHVQKSKTTHLDDIACILMSQKNETHVSTSEPKDAANKIKEQKNDCSTYSTSSVAPKESKQDDIIGVSTQAEHVLKPTSANSEIINTLTAVVSQKDQNINESGLSLESSNDKTDLLSNKDNIRTSVLNAMEGVDAASNDSEKVKSSTCGKEKTTQFRNANTIKDVDRETDNLLTVDQCDQILQDNVRNRDVKQTSVSSHIEEKMKTDDIPRPSQPGQQTPTQPKNIQRKKTKNSVLTIKLEKLAKENHKQKSKTTHMNEKTCIALGEKNEITVLSSEPEVIGNRIQEERNNSCLGDTASAALKETREDDIVGESTQAEHVSIPTSANFETINTLTAVVNQKDQKLPTNESGLSLKSSNDKRNLLSNKDDTSMSVLNTVEGVVAALDDNEKLKSSIRGKENTTQFRNTNTVEKMDKEINNLSTAGQCDQILQDDFKNENLKQTSMRSHIEKKKETDDIPKPSPSRQRKQTPPKNTMRKKTKNSVLTIELEKLAKENPEQKSKTKHLDNIACIAIDQKSEITVLSSEPEEVGNRIQEERNDSSLVDTSTALKETREDDIIGESIQAEPVSIPMSVLTTMEGVVAALDDNEKLKSSICEKENTTRFRNTNTVEKVDKEISSLLTADQCDQILQDDFKNADLKQTSVRSHIEEKMETDDISKPSPSRQRTPTQPKSTKRKKTKNSVLTTELEKLAKENPKQKSKTTHLDNIACIAVDQKSEITVLSSESEEVGNRIQEERNDSSLVDTTSTVLKETREDDIVGESIQTEHVSIPMSVLNTMEGVVAASNDSKKFKSSIRGKEKTTQFRNRNTVEKVDKEINNLLTVDQCDEILQDDFKKEDLKQTSVKPYGEEKMETGDISRSSQSQQQTPTQPKNAKRKKPNNNVLKTKFIKLAKKPHEQKSKTTDLDNVACNTMHQKNEISVPSSKDKEVEIAIQEKNDSSLDDTSNIASKETRQDDNTCAGTQAESTSANCETIDKLTAVVSQKEQKLPINESGLALKSADDKRDLLSNKDDTSVSVLNTMEGVDVTLNDNKELKSSTCGKEKATPLRNINTMEEMENETDNLLTADQCDQILQDDLKNKDIQQASVRSYSEEKMETDDIPKPSPSRQRTPTQPKSAKRRKTRNSVLTTKLEKLAKGNPDQKPKTTHLDNIACIAMDQKSEIIVLSSDPEEVENGIHEQKNDSSLDDTSSIAPKETREDDTVGECIQAEHMLLPTPADSETLNMLTPVLNKNDPFFESSDDLRELSSNKDESSMSVLDTMEGVEHLLFLDGELFEVIDMCDEYAPDQKENTLNDSANDEYNEPEILDPREFAGNPSSLIEYLDVDKQDDIRNAGLGNAVLINSSKNHSGPTSENRTTVKQPVSETEHVSLLTSADSETINTLTPVINEIDLSPESSDDIRELVGNEDNALISALNTMEGVDGSKDGNEELESNTSWGKENTTQLVINEQCIQELLMHDENSTKFIINDILAEVSCMQLKENDGTNSTSLQRNNENENVAKFGKSALLTVDENIQKPENNIQIISRDEVLVSPPKKKTSSKSKNRINKKKIRKKVPSTPSKLKDEITVLSLVENQTKAINDETIIQNGETRSLNESTDGEKSTVLTKTSNTSGEGLENMELHTLQGEKNRTADQDYECPIIDGIIKHLQEVDCTDPTFHLSTTSENSGNSKKKDPLDNTIVTPDHDDFVDNIVFNEETVSTDGRRDQSDEIDQNLEPEKECVDGKVSQSTKIWHKLKVQDKSQIVTPEQEDCTFSENQNKAIFPCETVQEETKSESMDVLPASAVPKQQNHDASKTFRKHSKKMPLVKKCVETASQDSNVSFSISSKQSEETDKTSSESNNNLVMVTCEQLVFLNEIEQHEQDETKTNFNFIDKIKVSTLESSAPTNVFPIDSLNDDQSCGNKSTSSLTSCSDSDLLDMVMDCMLNKITDKEELSQTADEADINVEAKDKFCTVAITDQTSFGNSKTDLFPNGPCQVENPIISGINGKLPTEVSEKAVSNPRAKSKRKENTSPHVSPIINIEDDLTSPTVHKYYIRREKRVQQNRYKDHDTHSLNATPTIQNCGRQRTEKPLSTSVQKNKVKQNGVIDDTKKKLKRCSKKKHSKRKTRSMQSVKHWKKNGFSHGLTVFEINTDDKMTRNSLKYTSHQQLNVTACSTGGKDTVMNYMVSNNCSSQANQQSVLNYSTPQQYEPICSGDESSSSDTAVDPIQTGQYMSPEEVFEFHTKVSRQQLMRPVNGSVHDRNAVDEMDPVSFDPSDNETDNDTIKEIIDNLHDDNQQSDTDVKHQFSEFQFKFKDSDVNSNNVTDSILKCTITTNDSNEGNNNCKTDRNENGEHSNSEPQNDQPLPESSAINKNGSDFEKSNAATNAVDRTNSKGGQGNSSYQQGETKNLSVDAKSIKGKSETTEKFQKRNENPEKDESKDQEKNKCKDPAQDKVPEQDEHEKQDQHKKHKHKKSKKSKDRKSVNDGKQIAECSSSCTPVKENKEKQTQLAGKVNCNSSPELQLEPANNNSIHGNKLKQPPHEVIDKVNQRVKLTVKITNNPGSKKRQRDRSKDNVKSKKTTNGKHILSGNKTDKSEEVELKKPNPKTDSSTSINSENQCKSVPIKQDLKPKDASTGKSNEIKKISQSSQITVNSTDNKNSENSNDGTKSQIYQSLTTRICSDDQPFSICSIFSSDTESNNSSDNLKRKNRKTRNCSKIDGFATANKSTAEQTGDKQKLQPSNKRRKLDERLNNATQSPFEQMEVNSRRKSTRKQAKPQISNNPKRTAVLDKDIVGTSQDVHSKRVSSPNITNNGNVLTNKIEDIMKFVNNVWDGRSTAIDALGADGDDVNTVTNTTGEIADRFCPYSAQDCNCNHPNCRNSRRTHDDVTHAHRDNSPNRMESDNNSVNQTLDYAGESLSGDVLNSCGNLEIFCYTFP